MEKVQREKGDRRRDAWKSLKKGILELEEEGGSWRESAKEPWRIVVTSSRNPKDTNGNHSAKAKEPVEVGAEDKEECGGRGSISPEKTVKPLFNNQSGVREQVMMEAEDKEEWGWRGSISPEKTLKALFHNQSGVRERVIMMVGVKSIEVMGSVKSVRNGDEDAKEIGDGVNEVLQVSEAGGS
jgi:hypothetical protein